MTPSPDHDATPAKNASSTRRTVLRTGAAITASGLGLATLTGQVAAHFPPKLDIDIVPGSEANPVIPNRFGMVPVAILQNDEFDPTSEDVRYRFGAPDVVTDREGARPIFDGFVTDVDDDGNDDLLLVFPMDGTGFDGDETEGRIEWERDESGEHGLSGTDAVTIVR
ncbi:hypothetical protein C479_05638 [Halovivax asiaticus JCM 14624]|uniref:Uncharacterized protein n=1 Tax=Halovivax asiaticus JCM 14624 TaxID=1227490 RepID=M0BN22_9EURY|nr:hypothetical protein [Halovivax asiaticus]ELZ12265.1 hypothetical protein C479_05638 [Halovivax asiaticus JCM 14624]